MSSTRDRLVLITGLLAACCLTSQAQTVYKWTDERGVIHFADEAPPNVHAEKRDLPPVPDRQRDSDEVKATEESAEKNTPAGKRPARVVVVSHKVAHSSPTVAHVSGKVENAGGAEAAGVGVTLSVLDATQGNPCLDQQAEVNPSTLPPGESGDFEVDLDSPCLAGNSTVHVKPLWK